MALGFAVELMSADSLAGDVQTKVAEVSAAPRPRTVTIVDAITMVEAVKGSQYFGSSHDLAHFSPDQGHFAVILKRGNVKTNCVDYSLVVYDTAEALRRPNALGSVVVKFSSSSNREGIDTLKWLNDHAIAFLGERPGESHQLFTVDVASRSVQRLTNHRTSVDSYAITADGKQWVFEAEQPAESLVDGAARRNGIVVTSQRLDDLLRLQSRYRSVVFRDLYAQREGASERRIITKGRIQYAAQIEISPDARYLVVQTHRRDPAPREWALYRDVHIQAELRANQPNEGLSVFSQLELIDLSSGKDAVLLDAPPDTGFSRRRFLWAPDSRSVLVSGTHLPLATVHLESLSAEARGPFVAEIRIRDKKIVPITSSRWTLHHWDLSSGRLVLEELNSQDVDEGPARALRKSAQGWSEVSAREEDLAESPLADVTIEQDMNTPARLFIKDRKSGHKQVLLDLNRQLRQLRLGRVQEIAFRTSSGANQRAGVYFPPDYSEGRRYPLVIQTHGWSPGEFWIDGPQSSAFAARPLAARGFLVVQLSNSYQHNPIDQIPKEQAAAYSGVIDALDEAKLIDRARIGLIGFSYSGLGVQYALAHFGPRYHIEAAVHADANDSGYFYYLSTLNSAPLFSTDIEALNDGTPFGAGTASWKRNSSSSGLDAVTTALRLQANDPYTLWNEWEWFVALRGQDKPAELVLFPDGTHVLVKPWERIVSQEGDVDWFDFWLNGHEDPDPAKRDEYTRWERLCDLQVKGNPGRPSFCVRSQQRH